MFTLKIWLGNLVIGVLAMLFLFFVFPLIDKWGSNQPAGVRPAARAVIILTVFFSELFASIALLFDCQVRFDDFIFYYPIWMIPTGAGLIVAVVKANKIYSKTHGYKTLKSYSERIELNPGERILHAARVRLFRGFEANLNNANLIVTSLRLIVEPIVSEKFPRLEEFLLREIKGVRAPNSLGFIRDRIILVLDDENTDLEFTVVWGRDKIIAAITKAIADAAWS